MLNVHSVVLQKESLSTHLPAMQSISHQLPIDFLKEKVINF